MNSITSYPPNSSESQSGDHPMGDLYEQVEQKTRELEEVRQTLEHLELKVQSLSQDKTLLQQRCEIFEQLGDLNQYKADLIARLNHELRTPLNSIIGFANLLLCDSKVERPELERNFLTRIVDNGKHLNDMINRMLDLSSLESGSLDLEYSAVDVSLLIGSLAETWSKRCHEKGIELHWAAPEKSALYPTDRTRLTDILNHLIGNALKFTKKGSITIEMSTHGQSGWPEEIRILDTGVGISAESQRYLFDPFQQDQMGSNRSYDGLGLGLALSSSLCRMLGMELSLENRPDGGTCARIRFPKTDQLSDMIDGLLSNEPAAPAGPDSNQMCLNKNVLVLSENLDLQILVTQQIQKGRGFVTQALNAQDARQYLESHEIDLILIDPAAESGMGMTILDGWHEDKVLPAVILLCDRPNPSVLSDYPISGNLGPEDLSDMLLPMVSAVLSPLHHPLS